MNIYACCFHQTCTHTTTSATQGVPNKGRLLTQLSAFWFEKLSSIIDNHVVASTLDTMPRNIRIQIEPYWSNLLQHRTLLVKKAKVIKLEAIVRGYLTGDSFLSLFIFPTCEII